MRDECTLYEWELLKVLRKLQPWGDERSDARAAMNTAAFIQTQRKDKFTESELDAFLAGLRSYIYRSWPDLE